MSQFPKQYGIIYTDTEVVPSVDQDGNRTITARAIFNDDHGYSGRETIQLDIETAAYLVIQLKEAIDAHYVDSITPKSPSEVF